MVADVKIKDFRIGKGHPCFIIAEAGVNHNGQLDLAIQLVDAALAAGADAVKFQTFKAEKVISPLAAKADYQVETTGGKGNQLDMVKRLELSYDHFESINDYCKQEGILFLSTPFDEESADFLEDIDIAAIKVSSGEITNLPFLQYLAKKNRPMIISTGMSNLGEVESAVGAIRKEEDLPTVLLHCVSNYPAEPSDVNLRTLNTLQVAFNVPVGFSDHTLGIDISLAAVALGACVIEKHITLDKNLSGPDQKASLEADEFGKLVMGIRDIEAALGDGIKKPAKSEMNTALVARRSLIAEKNIPKGVIITQQMIVVRRPGTGIPPDMQDDIVGRKTKVDIKAEDLFLWEMFE